MSQIPQIPAVTLRDGAELPMVGFGTWRLSGHDGCDAVLAALAAGYRHIDTATMYGNEDEVGRAVAGSGLDRAEVFLTTKLRSSDAGQEAKVLRRSLRALRTDYLDLWLVHWPPARRGLRQQVWNELCAAKAAGLVRSIGVSNYSLAQIDELAGSGELPAVNQVHWNPARFDAAGLAGHAERGVVLEGYSPLKGTNLADPVLAKVAAAHGVSPAQVVLRWHLEHQIPVLVKSAQPDRIRANLDVAGFALAPGEVAAIDQLGPG
jgi:diketogulonate reductase-like aldo/keto reductase